MLRKKIYVKYLLPGFFFPEETLKKIKKINPEKQAKDAPDNAYVFRYYYGTRNIKIGRIKITFKRKEQPKERYHINGVILNKDNYEQYLEKDSRYEDKVKKLKTWYKDGVILERLGNWQPILGNDILIKDGVQTPAK